MTTTPKMPPAPVIQLAREWITSTADWNRHVTIANVMNAFAFDVQDHADALAILDRAIATESATPTAAGAE